VDIFLKSRSIHVKPRRKCAVDTYLHVAAARGCTPVCFGIKPDNQPQYILNYYVQVAF